MAWLLGAECNPDRGENRKLLTVPQKTTYRTAGSTEILQSGVHNFFLL
jgi:hypothetical protein